MYEHFLPNLLYRPLRKGPLIASGRFSTNLKTVSHIQEESSAFQSKGVLCISIAQTVWL
jgi:hypothetical protein